MKENTAEKVADTNTIYKLIDAVVGEVGWIDNLDDLIAVINYLFMIGSHKIFGNTIHNILKNRTIAFMTKCIWRALN